MPIQNNIPRKNNVIPTGNVPEAIDRSLLEHRAIGFEGFTYSSPFTESGEPPLGTQPNNATIAHVSAMQVEAPGRVVLTKNFKKVHPSDKGTFFSTRQVTPIVKRVGGPSPSSDTPFHPKTAQAPNVRQPKRPLVSTEKAQSANAVATSKVSVSRNGTVPPVPRGTAVAPVGSFLQTSNQTLSSHSNHDLDRSRWNTIKKGAA